MTILKNYFHKTIYLYVFLFIIFLLMNYFCLNQYLIFFISIELTSIFFITCLLLELKFSIKNNNYLKKNFTYLIILIFFLCNFYYFSKFNFFYFYVNYSDLNTLLYNNSLSSVNAELYKNSNSYIMYIGFFFIITTFIIVIFIKNYNEKAIKNKFKDYYYNKTYYLSKLKIKL